ncbi:M48 family metalloprotease [Streptomyces sp. NPDC014991]|uniref:M48 family metalloprotease n=1 Tax=Streptomyces sp. NPDC014991 TaxID=3364935 RepID=UPI003700D018
MVVLLLAGAFAGQLVHNSYLGTSWAHAMHHCLLERLKGPTSPTPTQFSQLNDHWQRCTAPAQHRRALVSLAGALAVAVLGIASLWVLPHRVLRRAGPVTRASDEWQQRTAAAAKDMGITRVPLVVWGSVWLKESFIAGRPGGTTIVLPVGARALPPAQADALLRHELSHVAVGDVRLVWLTRGVLWALPPVLLVPLAVILTTTWRTAHKNPLTAFSGTFLWEYAIRAALLMIVSVLIAQLILRSREYEADARSVHGRSAAAMEALLASQPAEGLTWWQRARANHPAASRRVASLRRGPSPLRIPLVGTAAVGLLSAMALQAVTSLAQDCFTGTPLAGKERLAAALIAGGLLSASWGVATWHTVIAGKGSDPVPRTSLLVLGTSTALGLFAQVERTGTTDSGTMFGWPLLVTVPVAAAGAGALSVALAGLWARRRRPHRSRWDWATALCVNAVLFAGALRFGEDTALFLHAMDWRDAFIVSGLYSPAAQTTAVALGAVGLSTLWATLRGNHRHEPSGTRHKARAARRPRTWRGVASTIAAGGPVGTMTVSLVAAAAAVAARWAVQPAAAQGSVWMYRIEFDWWSAAGAGCACVLALIAFRGIRGLAEAVYAAPIASLLAAAAMWGHRFAQWAHPWEVTRTYATAPLAQVAYVIVVLAVPAAFLPARRAPRLQRTLPAIVLVAALSTGIVLAILHTGTRLLFAPP